jgi:hypothetical protein
MIIIMAINQKKKGCERKATYVQNGPKVRAIKTRITLNVERCLTVTVEQQENILNSRNYRKGHMFSDVRFVTADLCC